VLGALELFDGTTPFLNAMTKLPTHYGDGSWPNYVESTAGQYFVDTGNGKSGPFFDTVARHGAYYSRFHKSKRFCGTCHDVSNPVLANVTRRACRSGKGRQLLPRRAHVQASSLSAYAQPSGAASTIPGISTAAVPGLPTCATSPARGNKTDAPTRT
jgi:hypothetical protein